jgi:hypothetical protein
MSSYSLLVFRRNSSGWAALVNVGGLMALFGMGLEAGAFFGWPLSMTTRRLRGLLIGFILNFVIIAFRLLLLLLYNIFFTSFGIGGRRVTPSGS